MAEKLFLGFTIGATLTSGFMAAFAGANKSITKLGEASEKLQAKQSQLFSQPTKGMAGLSKINNEYKQLGKLIEKANRTQEKLNHNIKRAGELKLARADLRTDAMETIALGFAVGAPVFGAVKQAMNFESAMAGVKKTVDFQTPEGFNQLSQDILQLSKTIPLAATELASITASGGQLGVAEKDLLGFTQTVATMGVAFDMAADEAGDSMAKLANVYQIPIANIGAVGDAINELSNSSPAKANQIVTTLGRVGGLAQQFGLTVNQATALSGTFIALGKPPEVAATAINGLMTTLSTLDPKNKKQAGVFKQLGMDMQQFNQLVKTDGQQAILTLLDSINKLPQNERIGTLTGIFGREYAGQIAALSSGIDTYTGQLQTLQAVDAQGKPQYLGSMGREFASISGTTENKLALFKNNITLVGIKLGNILIPTLNELLLAAIPIIDTIGTLIEQNPQAVKTIVMLGAALLAGKLGFIGLRYGLNLFFSGANSISMVVNLLTGKFTLLKAASKIGFNIKGLTTFGKGIKWLVGIIRVAGMGLLTNPLFLAIGLLAVAAFLIYRNWKPIKQFFKNTWANLKAFAQSGIGNITRTILSWSPFALFYRVFAKVMNYFGIQLPTKFTGFGGMIIHGLTKGITNAAQGVYNKIGEVTYNIVQKAKGILGINSPSRVFMGLGHNIAEGTAIGIAQGTGKAVTATTDMAKRIAQTEYSSRVLAKNSVKGRATGGSQQFYFSPTINLGSGSASEVNQAMQTAFTEFKRMMAQYEHDKTRRAFA